MHLNILAIAINLASYTCNYNIRYETSIVYYVSPTAWGMDISYSSIYDHTHWVGIIPWR